MNSAEASPPSNAAGERWIAFGWGFAEATFFFLVPDVFTSRVAVRDLRAALAACVSALAGALLGGAAIHLLARHAEAAPLLAGAFAWLPGIPPTLIDEAGGSLARDGLGALFAGAMSGVPYKLFAFHAGQQGIGMASFLAVSVAARLARFATVTVLAHLIARRLLSKWPPDKILIVHAVAWAAFYAWYFWVMRAP